MSKSNIQIEMVDGTIIDNILELWKAIEDQGERKRINYHKSMSVDDAREILRWMKNMPMRIETQILLDDIMISVIRGISSELAEELKGYLG